MRDAADLQIESYQAESGLKYARTLTAYSMLGANGIQPDLDPEGKAEAGSYGTEHRSCTLRPMVTARRANGFGWSRMLPVLKSLWTT
jgi:hypothetical protein